MSPDLARCLREERESAERWRRAGDRFELFQVEAWLLEWVLISAEVQP